LRATGDDPSALRDRLTKMPPYEGLSGTILLGPNRDVDKAVVVKVVKGKNFEVLTAQ
jgi:hypothetical protein